MCVHIPVRWGRGAGGGGVTSFRHLSRSSPVFCRWRGGNAAAAAAAAAAGTSATAPPPRTRGIAVGGVDAIDLSPNSPTSTPPTRGVCWGGSTRGICSADRPRECREGPGSSFSPRPSALPMLPLPSLPPAPPPAPPPTLPRDAREPKDGRRYSPPARIGVDVGESLPPAPIPPTPTPPTPPAPPKEDRYVAGT